jgi:hypothetical protein
VPVSHVGTLSIREKFELAVRVWTTFVAVELRLRREPLPDLVSRLCQHNQSDRRYSPARLSRAVWRSLRVGKYRPKCLVNSLVLFHLLCSQGDKPQLVIGLPDEPQEHFAHAWVEIDGVDVGPPPGRSGHLELARFG